MSTRKNRPTPAVVTVTLVVVALVVALGLFFAVNHTALLKTDSTTPPVASTPPASTPSVVPPTTSVTPEVTKVPPTASTKEPPRSTLPPVAKTIVEHQYRRYVEGTPAVTTKQVRMYHWAKVPGYVDRQQVWMDKNGDETVKKQDAVWMAESAAEILAESGPKTDEYGDDIGWKVGDTRTQVVQPEVKDGYEYLIYGAEGKLHFSTNKADASWIGASLAKKLHTDDNGFEAFAKRTIPLD